MQSDIYSSPIMVQHWGFVRIVHLDWLLLVVLIMS
jgi:hypothetical protein